MPAEPSRISGSGCFETLLYEKQLHFFSLFVVGKIKELFSDLFLFPIRLRGGAFQTAHLTHPPPTNMATEQTYIMIKPDGVQRGLVGQIIQRFEQKGFFLRGMKMMQTEKAHAEKHYADLSSKPFFGDLVDYMCSGPVVCMVWEGKEVVKTGRKIIGATNPL